MCVTAAINGWCIKLALLLVNGLVYLICRDAVFVFLNPVYERRHP